MVSTSTGSVTARCQSRSAVTRGSPRRPVLHRPERAFVQDVDYQPLAAPNSTGAQPGTTLYSSEQWNFGDSLAAFDISQLGARLYDPAIGRFVGRDPLLIPRTVATTNSYAFASNDPVIGNSSVAMSTTMGRDSSG